MVEDFPLVITKQYQQESIKWLTAIKRHENVLVTFFPKTDRLRRLQQFLENKEKMKPILENNAKYLFQVFEFGLHNIEDKQDLYNHIAGNLNSTQLLASPQSFNQWLSYLKKNNTYLILVIPQTEGLWSTEGQTALLSLSYLVDEYYPYISCLSFSEKDISHPMVVPYLPDSMRLYQNMYYYPLYNPDDALIFVRYLEKKWNMSLDKRMEMQIMEDCGGHMWLLKEAVRQSDAADYPLYPGEGLKFRLDVVYKQLFDSEQTALNKIVSNKQNFLPEEKHSLEYLQKLRFIDINIKCTIGLYKEFILNLNRNKTDLTVKDNHLILNQVPMERFFSRKEYRVVKILLEKRGEIVSRDEIAKHIWPTNTQENYSDWAIDQLIARVRRRLQHLSLSPKMLQSIRGRGYLLKLQ